MSDLWAGVFLGVFVLFPIVAIIIGLVNKVHDRHERDTARLKAMEERRLSRWLE